MKVAVAVVVHDRIKNIERWINCWKQSHYFNDPNVELFIIHNYYSDQLLMDRMKALCDKSGICYIPRSSGGYDIGAMQDAFNERLYYLNGWDYILWCTDDVIPMRVDFLKPFLLEIIQPGVGIAAMQISTEHVPHVRTTGFMISKEISKKIIFPANPVKTIGQCHLFEHSNIPQNLTLQVRAMGLKCVQVAPLLESPLYDMGWPYRNRQVLHKAHVYDRMKEHERIFVSSKVIL